MASNLRLRPLRSQDENAALAAHGALAQDDFTFLLDYIPGEPWATYLHRLSEQRRGLNLAEDRVPATFLVASVGGELVGRISIRHTLNDYLAGYGGHIGYGIVPEHRRRGHASEMLRQGLIVARSFGVESVLVTCDEDNLVSARVIEKNGGILESVIEQPGSAIPLRRYWID
ncbi:MAG: GNAT family N-acetyltransferase [Mycobacteriales bacterium]